VTGESFPSVRIKVCGITNEADALYAAELGADAVGFVFAASPRQISADEARAITAVLPPFVQTVGVFVDEDPATVEETAAFCRLNMVQFHGKESAAYCARFGGRAIKAIRVRDGAQLTLCSQYSKVVGAILLDSYVSGLPGGTGRSFDWSLAREAGQYGRIILAGGLNPENVLDAISAVHPYAVDASSGLEVEPGVKDHGKMARFVRAVKGAGK